MPARLHWVTAALGGAGKVGSDMPSEDAGTTWVELDAEGRYVDADGAALEAYGLSADELREHSVGDFAPPGLGRIHRALFLWIVKSGRDFGGGESTIMSVDGQPTPIRCSSVRKIGDRYRVSFEIASGESVPPHSDALAGVLEAWRQAERDLADGGSDLTDDVARTVASSLRDIYQYVAREKAAATTADDSVEADAR